MKTDDRRLQERHLSPLGTLLVPERNKFVSISSKVEKEAMFAAVDFIVGDEPCQRKLSSQGKDGK